MLLASLLEFIHYAHCPSMEPSHHLFCWREIVQRGASLFLYFFLETMRCKKSRNLLPDHNSLSATVAAHLNDDWTGKDLTFLFLSLVTIDALPEKTCTDKETIYLKIFFALSQPEKQQRAKLKHKKKEGSQKPNNQMLPKTQPTNLLL